MLINHRKKFLSVMISLFISTSVAAYAQVPDTLWTKMYGITGPYEWFQSVEQLSDNGYLLAGSWNEDLMLMRTDEKGDTIWTKIYGAAGDDCGFSAIPTDDGGFIVVGLRATQNGDLWILKTDALGDTIWTKTYGDTQDDIGFSIQKTDDGGYIVYGQTESLGGIYGSWLLKIDSIGDTLWTRIYEDFVTGPGGSLHQTDEGGYVFTAGKLNAIAYEAYLMKTDSIGNPIWTHRFCGLGSEIFTSLTPTTDGGYVAAGYTGPIGSLIQDAWILKANSAGDSLWAVIYGGPGHEEFRAVKQTTGGGYVVAGAKSIAPFAESYVWLMRLSANGDSTWARSWSGGDAAECSAVDICTDGGYILAGSAFLLETYDDAWLLKTEPDVGVVESHEDDMAAVSLNVTPNPFSKLTNVSFGIEQSAERIELRIYDVNGRLVKDFGCVSVIGHQSSVKWDGTDEAHRPLGSGVYLCEMRTPNSRLIEKIIYIE
ncbi:MAG: T9SS type A sorting domain-containing protein [candidate division WOR-3 bacterium]|nr:MAG: T9SS type A sorting domain-containing protein [candidate division WOR-3 bacterium]